MSSPFALNENQKAKPVSGKIRTHPETVSGFSRSGLEGDFMPPSSPAAPVRPGPPVIKVPDRASLPLHVFERCNIQPKPAIGGNDTVFEREADAAADCVTDIPGSLSDPDDVTLSSRRRRLNPEDNGGVPEHLPSGLILPARPAEDGNEPDAGAYSVILPEIKDRLDETRGGGRALSSETQGFMENRFFADFSRVRVHTGGQAVWMNRALGARAFTLGSDVYFNSGRYDPASTQGMRLLAHELTHVLQQRQADTALPVIRRMPEEGSVISPGREIDWRSVVQTGRERSRSQSGAQRARATNTSGARIDPSLSPADDFYRTIASAVSHVPGVIRRTLTVLEHCRNGNATEEEWGWFYLAFDYREDLLETVIGNFNQALTMIGSSECVIFYEPYYPYASDPYAEALIPAQYGNRWEILVGPRFFSLATREASFFRRRIFDCDPDRFRAIVLIHELIHHVNGCGGHEELGPSRNPENYHSLAGYALGGIRPGRISRRTRRFARREERRQRREERRRERREHRREEAEEED